MTGSPDRRQGFTLVEMLVVIGVITLLAGILLPALAGVRRRALKSEETNQLRQVGIGWNLYANGNDDAALPGYLEPEVQEDWGVRYKFQDRSTIDAIDAAPWVWRLMPHLSYDHGIVHGYLNEPNEGDLQMIQEAEEVARHPAFGYNAFYVGGWWHLDTNYNPDRALPYLNDAFLHGPNQPARAIVRSPSEVRDPSRLVLFCASAHVAPGTYDRLRNDTLGAHWVTPPNIADANFWREYGDSPDDPPGGATGVKVLRHCAIPIGRYTGAAATLHADLHMDILEPTALGDQRYWVNIANDRRFSHSIVDDPFDPPWETPEP